MEKTPALVRARKVVVVTFLSLYIPIILVVGMPPMGDRHSRLKATLVQFLNPLQLWQSWWMFAAPPHEDFTLQARVTQASGKQSTWSVPRAYGTSYPRGYLVGRYAKWIETAQNADRYSVRLGQRIWAEACAHIARLVEASSTDPVVHVELLEVRRSILPPELARRAEAAPEFRSLYHYSVNARKAG